MAQASPSLLTRMGLAFRVLLSADLATRLQQLDAAGALPAARPAEQDHEEEHTAAAQPEAPAEPAATTPPPEDAAVAQRAGGLLVLGLLQREGRLIDFLEQDIDSFDDEDVGAAARQVHEGCRRALRGHGTLQPLHEQAEDSAVTVPAQYDAAAFKLSGKVQGAGPYRGKLVHRGWRLQDLSLPELVAGADATVLAPAEVEVR